MRGLRYIFLCVILLTAATTYVYSQSWDMFFNKGKEHYDKGNYEKAIKNFELYLKYESDNPKAEVKQLLEQAKKRLAEKADTPTNAEQVTPADITQLTEKPSPKVTEQPTQAEQPHEEFFIETALGLNMKMIYVEGGTFMMGARTIIQHTIKSDTVITDTIRRLGKEVALDSYYIAEFEITQSQWEKVMGTTIQQQTKKERGYTRSSIGDNIPMHNINWEEMQSFCANLSILSGKKYLLPTEAQWEFAARGGNKSKGYGYSGSNEANEVAWYAANSEQRLHPVGQKMPNELGIYDMTGNVAELCCDGDSRQGRRKYKARRGGAVNDNALWDHTLPYISERESFLISGRSYHVGFRVVCIPD